MAVMARDRLDSGYEDRAASLNRFAKGGMKLGEASPSRFANGGMDMEEAAASPNRFANGGMNVFATTRDPKEAWKAPCIPNGFAGVEGPFQWGKHLQHLRSERFRCVPRGSRRERFIRWRKGL